MALCTQVLSAGLFANYARFLVAAYTCGSQSAGAPPPGRPGPR